MRSRHWASRLVAVGVTLMGMAGSARAVAAPAAHHDEQKATLLADSLGIELQRGPWPATGYVLGSVGVLFGSWAVYFNVREGWSAPGGLLVAGPTLLALGSFGSYAVPEQYYAPTLLTTLDVSLAASWLGLSLLGEPAAPALISAAAMGTRAALRTADALVTPPTPRSALLRDYRTLRVPAKRAALQPHELARVEQRLLHVGPNLSPWLLHAPVLVGGATALGLMAHPDYDADDRRWAAYHGGMLLLFGFVGIASDSATGRARYEDQLPRTGLRLSAAPGPGLGGSLTGSF